MNIPRSSGLTFLACAALSVACSGHLTVLSSIDGGADGDSTGSGGATGTGGSGATTGSGGAGQAGSGGTEAGGSSGAGAAGAAGSSGGSSGSAGSGGVSGSGGAGTGGGGGGIISDSATCGCVTGHIGWGFVGGHVPYNDTSALEVCNLFVHQRVWVAQDPPALFCEQQFNYCTSSIGPGDVTRAVAHADVRAAIAAAPVLYGEDPRAYDGQVQHVQIGSAIVEVGLPCKVDECKPIPAGVSALAALLEALTKQELSRSPCNGTFPPPP
jgi:hypothetical protein